MTYRVTRHDNTRISIELAGQVAFELERENEGRGIWALYPVRNRARGVKITSDQYANDLIEWVTSGLVRGGHVARVAEGYVVQVPAEARDFYVSGTGYLCCRAPVRMVLAETPVIDLGIQTRQQIRAATPAEREAAGLDLRDASLSAVFLALRAE